MPPSVKKSVIAIVGIAALVLAEIILTYIKTVEIRHPEIIEGVQAQLPPATKSSTVFFLAFGDINLGRKLGRRILDGHIDHPFEKIRLQDDSADIIFMNLESPLSDQNGETVSPRSNIVFTGPPAGARTLKNAGVTVVSTANNHALDYGAKAAFETIDHLRSENILFSGTSKSKDSLFFPLLIEKNNIKFAIFAVTAFVNFAPPGWREVVASADTAILGKEIAKIRSIVDVIVVSYHGGVEYTAKPAHETIQFARWCVSNGVDVFLGHHPHVTFGMEKHGEKIIVHSLGNFIFYQPQAYWTQRSYGVKIFFEKKDSIVRYDIRKLIPIRVGFQTERLTDSVEVSKLKERTQQISNIDLSTYWK